MPSKSARPTGSLWFAGVALALAFVAYGCSGGGSDPKPPAGSSYNSGHMAGDDVSGARRPKDTMRVKS